MKEFIRHLKESTKDMILAIIILISVWLFTCLFISCLCGCSPGIAFGQDIIEQNDGSWQIWGENNDGVYEYRGSIRPKPKQDEPIDILEPMFPEKKQERNDYEVDRYIIERPDYHN